MEGLVPVTMYHDGSNYYTSYELFEDKAAVIRKTEELQNYDFERVDIVLFVDPPER